MARGFGKCSAGASKLVVTVRVMLCIKVRAPCVGGWLAFCGFFDDLIELRIRATGKVIARKT